MIPKSIRWQLPLSYAAIALLATLALGAVLLITLRGYYVGREQDYLRGNARAIGAVVAQLVAGGLSPAALESELKSFSFLSQSRVRVLDPEGQVLADSGSPEERRQVVALSMRGEQDLAPAPEEVAKDVSVIVEMDTLTHTVGEGRVASFWVIEDPSTAQIITQTMVITARGPADQLIEVIGTEAGPELISLLPAVGTPYGFGLNSEITTDGRRSDQVVVQPIRDAADILLGYVELSSGPAYGRQILDSVARGWAISSGVAVLLAAAVGWGISRRLSGPLLTLTGVTARMAGGDLFARAEVGRHTSHELGLLADSFNEMAQRVEETVVALRRFVSDAAHELHTPLTALRTTLELASSGAAVEPGGYLERAVDQVARLEALTGDLLDLSRLESGGGPAPAERTPIELGELLRESAELVASQAEQAGLSFGLDVPAEPVRVRGDAGQLRRVLRNLIDNAVKFTPEGGQVSVGLRHTPDRAWAELWVEDTGIGIPASDLPQLFSRFHRGRNAAAYPGSGLGLAIVRAIAEGHGGQVRAETTGQGARFSVRLPLAEKGSARGL